MKFYNKILLFTAFFLLHHYATYSQGCIAIRACGGSLGTAPNLAKGDFAVQTNYRYFKSFRHFRGDHEEAERVEAGTEVINKSHFLDISLTYGFTDRFFVAAIVPFVNHHRSSMYEHGGNPPNGLGERHTTQSQGLADIRLAGGYWLFNPQTHPFNYSVAVGIKLPTGKYDYTDTFYNQGTNKDQDIEAVVDQSIQPGDGAYGFTIDVQGFHPLSQHFVWSSNLYYMLSPQESNGMLTRTGTSEYSCPDQFSVRTGIFYNAFSNWNAFLGMRCEGVPSKDIIGGSDGFRRPGYAVSAEPSIGYNKNRLALQLSVPFALYRNRTQSYLDKQRTEETGVYTQGDAAFADYLINVNAAYRFSKNHKKMKLLPTKTENE